MARNVRCALIQARTAGPAESPLEKIKQVMIDKHVAMIRQAAMAGAQIVCLQEIFTDPIFARNRRHAGTISPSVCRTVQRRK